MPRVLLLLPTSTYRAPDFVRPRPASGVEVVVGSEERQALAGGHGRPGGGGAARRSRRRGRRDRGARRGPRSTRWWRSTTRACSSPPPPASGSASPTTRPPRWRPPATRRRCARALARARCRSRRFAVVDDDDDLPDVELPGGREAGRPLGEPGRDPRRRRRRGARRASPGCGRIADGPLLVEEYVPGDEVAVEGLLRDGVLEVLAVFDKPDPLVGPYFEETIYVTPSRLDRADARRASATSPRARARRSAWSKGPVHAELRVDGDRVWVIEVAARSIGGLCARALRFGAGIALEELILRHALGMPLDGLAREPAASGVMMLPIPRAGVLRAVDGQDAARAVPGVTGLEITVPRGRRVRAAARRRPLPRLPVRARRDARRGRGRAARRRTPRSTSSSRPPRSLERCASSSSRPTSSATSRGTSAARRPHLRARPRGAHGRRVGRPGTRARRRGPTRSAFSVPMHTATRLAPRPRPRGSTDRCAASGSTPTSAPTSPPRSSGTPPLPGARRGCSPLDRYARLEIDGEQRLVGGVVASHGCAHRCRHCPVPVVYDGRVRLARRGRGARRHRPAGRGRRAPHHLRRPRLPQRAAALAARRRRDARALPRRHVRLHGEGRARAAARRPVARARRPPGACSWCRRSSRSTTRCSARLDKGHTTADAGARRRRAARRGHRRAAVVAAVHAVDHPRRPRSRCSTSCTSTTSSAASTRCSTASGCCSHAARCCSTIRTSRRTSARGTTNAPPTRGGRPTPRSTSCSSRLAAVVECDGDAVELYAQVREPRSARRRSTSRPSPPVAPASPRAGSAAPNRPNSNSAAPPRAPCHSSASAYAHPSAGLTAASPRSVPAEHVEGGAGAEPRDVLVRHRVRGG